MKKVALYFVLATLSLIIALVSSGLILNAIYTYQAQNPAAPKVELKESDEQAGAGDTKLPSEYKTGVSYEKAMKENKLVVIDFYADWCPHCQRLAPIYDEVSKEFKGKVNFVTINSEDAKNQKLMEEYQIQYFPTVYVVNPKTNKKEQIDSSLIFDKSTFEDKVQEYVDNEF
ncbi:MAG TPA: thioredoxin family protein [Candidatus Adamsella sp.]|nr:thioredoxin family protein [Candidatus Adamsella sp.]